MAKIVQIAPLPNKVWFYSGIAVGDLFRFAYPLSEQNIYMKTNNPDYCLHINTGNLYVITAEKEVLPYRDEVTIRNT